MSVIWCYGLGWTVSACGYTDISDRAPWSWEVCVQRACMQLPKRVRIYPQRMRASLLIKLQESSLQFLCSSGSAFQVSRKSFQLNLLRILIPGCVFAFISILFGQSRFTLISIPVDMRVSGFHSKKVSLLQKCVTMGRSMTLWSESSLLQSNSQK